VAYHATCVVCNNATPTLLELKKLDLSKFTDDIFKFSLDVVLEQYRGIAAKTNERPDKVAKGTDLLNNLNDILCKEHPSRVQQIVESMHKVRDIIKEHKMT
jgi:hypothetical protein